RDLADKCRGIRHTKAVSAERTKTHDAEIRITEHNRVRRAPFHIRELLRIDKVNFGLEGRVKAVFPGAEFCQDGRVAAVDLVFPGRENVCDLAFVHEDRRLRLANDKLRTVLDLLALDRK